MTAEAANAVTMRRATSEDAGPVADVYLTAFHATYDFPLAHTDDEVRGWVADWVVPSLETWIAEDAGRIVAMMALGDEELDQLYVHPDHHGRGIGGALVELAKERRPAGLQLYTFQVNARARRFYEHLGFVVVDLNDGSRNEERQPDVQYRWRP